MLTIGGIAGYRIISKAKRAHTTADQAPTLDSGKQRNIQFIKAPPEVKECTIKIISQGAFDIVVQGQRLANDEELSALSTCYSKPKSLATTTTEKKEPTSSPSSKPTTNQNNSAPSSKPQVDIHPEVWTKNGYDGASYEYKVNCGSNYTKLEQCFLWDITRVVVASPSGTPYDLKKDFNVNSYSGEITRRWVLYGPGGGGLPQAGRYTFTYYKDSTLELTQTVDYSPEIVNPPSNITYTRNGADITISWQAPAGISSTMWYKPSIDPPGNERQIITKVIAWDRTSALLENPPVSTGEQLEINVAIFFPGGYAYPQPITITW